MAESLVKELVDAGIHFGQRASNWNPRMSPYIYGKRNGIHIIDIKETVKGLLLAKKFVARVVGEGKDVVFIGTKRQAKNVIDEQVPLVGMHRVTERWLGGTLTNFRTIRQRLKRLEELESIAKESNFAGYSKKMESQLRRELKKIFKNLDGIRAMDKIPGAMVVVDVRREITAIREARKMGVPTICLIDTDADPSLADIAIPGNDDSMRSIEVVIRELCKSIAEGKQARTERQAGERDRSDSDDAAAEEPRRRSRRAQFRSDEQGGSGAPSGAAEPAIKAD
ncbi:MAG: 30S ribosomal protein S2 [Phycisphaeraceae bacterium]|nr:30S ribosomal protein S2 [Phycisphaeraceae bacterium]